MRSYFLVICLFFSLAVKAQSPRVPSKMKFANLTLHIKDDARREIQKDVDALTRSERHYNIYVQRARTYFPIIERVFKEEGVPTDFKYLAIQESGLLPDVVSSSNAVGYWQFKDFTAREVGLRVDKNVDERMNISAASRGAAKYIKKNNARFFDNWLVSLQAYQMGPGGAIQAGGKKYQGKKTMTIDRKTYWYVKKFLAHMVAFENASQGKADLQVVEYTKGGNKSLTEISRETGVSKDKLEPYNKWLRKGRIPTDKSYAVILPVTSAKTVQLVSQASAPSSPGIKKVTASYSYEYAFTKVDYYPNYKNRADAFTGKITVINNIKAIVARKGDRAVSLASKGDISVSNFFKYNDLKKGDRLIEGQVYYLQKKKSKQPVFHHVAREGESLWEISQLYGISLKKLKTRNRIRGKSTIDAQQIVWLRYIRPNNIPVEYKIPDPVSEPVMVVEKIAPTQEQQEEVIFASEESSAMDVVVEEQVEDVPEWPNSVAADELNGDESDSKEDAVESREWKTEEKDIIHTVTSGETLYSISRKYEIGVNQLASINDISLNDPLKIGQELVVKGDKPSADAENSPGKNAENADIYYTVKAGDTMYGISRKYDIGVEELRKLNNKADYVVKTGEKLRVK
jgi:membrane-bound lytic murein transglycosylase D